MPTHLDQFMNKAAGDHFTPREVIRLMVSLLFINDDDFLATAGRDVVTIKDQQAERVIAAQENMDGKTGKGPRSGQTLVGAIAPLP